VTVTAGFSSVLPRTRKPCVAQRLLDRSIRGREILVAGIAGGSGSNNSPKYLAFLVIQDAGL
jgi:hypothetical protein